MRPESHLSRTTILAQREVDIRTQEEVPGAIEWIEHCRALRTLQRTNVCTARTRCDARPIANGKMSLNPHATRTRSSCSSAGLLPNSEKNTLLWHVAECDMCETLRKAIEITSDVLPPRRRKSLPDFALQDGPGVGYVVESPRIAWAWGSWTSSPPPLSR